MVLAAPRILECARQDAEFPRQEAQLVGTVCRQRVYWKGRQAGNIRVVNVNGRVHAPASKFCGAVGRAVNPFLTLAWRSPPRLGTPIGRFQHRRAKAASRRRSVAGRSRVRGLMMIATVISKVLSVKSGTVLIAALAASAIDALPAVAGPERLAHVAGFRGHAAASRMDRVLCAATGRVCRRHDGTARPRSLTRRRGRTWCASTSRSTRRSNR